jgi:tetratricopeptide (TPR) repeat protein
LALRYSEQALSILKEVGDRSAEGWAFKCLGRVYYDLGEQELARECYEQARGILREVGDHRGEGRVLNNLGLVCDVQGQEARKYFAESLRILKEVGDRWGESKTMWNISIFYFRQHRYDVALACFLLTRNIFDEVQAPNRAKVQTYLDKLCEELGEERFVALLARVEAQAHQIVEQALCESIEIGL